MTTWQWSVIVAICRVVIKLIDRDEIYQSDYELLNEAIERNKL